MAFMNWTEIIKTNDYKSMDEKARSELKAEYFDNVVKPKCKPEEVNEAWGEFNQWTSGMDQQEAPNYNDPDAIFKKHDLYQPEYNANINSNVRTKQQLTPEQEAEAKEKSRKFKEEYDAERENLNHPKTKLGKVKSAIYKGIENSTMSRLSKEAGGQGFVDYQIDEYQPETFPEKVISGASGILTDTPVFMLGGALGEAGGAIGSSAGAFGLHSGMTEGVEQHKKDGDISLDDALEIAKETGKGAGLGAVVGVAGKIGNLAGKQAGKLPGMVGKTAEYTAPVLTETGALVVGDSILNDNPITLEGSAESLATILLLKSLHANPFTRKAVEQKAAELDTTPEKVVGNIDRKMIERVKSVEDAIKAIEDAGLKTEAELKAERIKAIQDELINKQFTANYKEGKTPEDIIQIRQIPLDYIKFMYEDVDGRVQLRPEVSERIEARLGNNPFTDSLPFDISQPDFEGVKKHHSIRKANLEASKELLSRAEAQRDDLYNKYLAEEHTKLAGQYRRYEHILKVREKMDEVMGFAESVLTPENKRQIAEEPDTLMDHINPVESGYNDLRTKNQKPGEESAYQKAVETEILAKIFQDTNTLPDKVYDKIMQRANIRINKEMQPYYDDIKNKESALHVIENSREYKDYLNSIKTPAEIRAELEQSLKKIDDDYAKQIEYVREITQPDLQKILGVSPEYGDRALNAAEVYGTHYNNLMEWFKKPLKDITRTLEKAGYLDFTVNKLTSIFNKSRIIQQRLGEEVYRVFVDPLREATWTFTKELSIYKDKADKLKGKEDDTKRLTPKQRQEIGAYMLGQQNEALPTLQKMGINIPKWGELTPKQQAVINEFQAIIKLIFDRINTARKMAGLEPLNEVKNYFTFIRKFQMIERQGFNILTIDKTAFDNIEVSDAHTRALSFAFGKERQGSTRDLELDAFTVMDKYMYAALRTIHLTPVIGRLREALKSEKLMLANRNAYEYLNMTLDVVSGKAMSEAKRITNEAANLVHRNLTAATLVVNAHTIAIQPASLATTGVEIGPKYLAMGVKDFCNPAMRNFAMKEANTLLTRTYDASIDEIKKGAFGKIAKAQTWGIEKGNIPTKYVDKWAAEITWLGGYRYAMEELNLNHKGCRQYADDLVIRTQGSADRLDLAPIQHTPIGKLATTFQTFAINQFGWLKDEVFGLAKTHKLVKEGIDRKAADMIYKSDGYILMPIGDGKVNVYETKRIKETPDILKKAASFMVAAGAVNVIYELLGGALNATGAGGFIGTTAPYPAPMSSFWQGVTGQEWVDSLFGKNPSKQEVQLINGFLQSLKETSTLLPVVGGAAKYGGPNAAGAFGALVSDTLDIIAERPGAKPWAPILTKWAGIPGSVQTFKILKQIKKNRDESEKERNRKPQAEYKKERERQKRIKREQQKHANDTMFDKTMDIMGF